MRRLPHRAAWLSAVVTTALVLFACRSTPPGRDVRAPAGAVVPSTPGKAAARLVVLVVIDQLPSWAMDRYLPFLDADGALRTLIARGRYFPASRFAYAATYTAPGHASLVTGALPRDHGVVANEVWDARRGRSVSVVDDGSHAVFGDAAAAASPAVLVAESVVDVLEAETGGASRTVSLSFKDRSAVLLGGRRPDVALFYDTKRGAFTSSSYYAKALPEWLVRFETEHPAERRWVEWNAEDPLLLAERFGPDDSAGKGDWHGLGRSFPHHPGRSREPRSTFRATPAASDYLLDLALASVQALELGRDQTPDLLLLSLSGVDYVGHIFGTESWEYADNLRRVDRALGRFLRELEARAPLRVLVTSDHGAAYLPERSSAAGRRALRLSTSEIAKRLNERFAPAAGATPPIAAYVEPFLYFSSEARASPAYPSLVAKAAQWVREIEGIDAAYSVADLTSSRLSGGGVETLVRASVRPGAGGDVFVVVSEHSVIDPRLPGGSGTSHGSPWAYDQLVPVICYGAGISPSTHAREVDVLRVAASLASLLGVRPPTGTALTSLPGCL